MFPERYSVLVVGTPEAGLFEFCTFLASFYLRNSQSVVLIEADISASFVRRQLRNYGIRPEEYEGSYLTLIDCFSSSSSEETQAIIGNPADLPGLLEQIREAVDASIEPVRVILDSVSPLHIHSTPGEVKEFVVRLSEVAKKKGSLTMTLHKEMHTAWQFDDIVSTCNALLEMKMDDQLKRFIRLRQIESLDSESVWIPFEIEALTMDDPTALLWKKSEDYE